MTENDNGHIPAGTLRATIQTASNGMPMNRLTVLSSQRDPYRIDTPANHRDAEWLAEQVNALVTGPTVHLRGLHYVIVSAEAIKPNGKPYRNIDEDWEWLSEKAAKAARWLGHVGFDRIHDSRNAAPIIQLAEDEEPHPVLTAGLNVAELIPPAEEIEPRVNVRGFTPRQRYRIVLIAEKQSAEPILSPLAEYYGADLYLPTGEPSDTMIHTMAKTAATDGRRTVVLYFADSDPAGWQMPISVARKLQALETAYFPDLDYEVRRVGLVPDQVREYGLPSTPLKATEKRADRWTAATGTAQTEIDALAALRPDLLTQLARAAIRPFYDTGLEERVRAARREYLEMAQAKLDAAIGPEDRERLAVDLRAGVESATEQLEALTEAIWSEIPDGVLDDLPTPVVPEAVDNREKANGLPLIDSGMDWVEQTLGLVADRAYQ